MDGFGQEGVPVPCFYVQFDAALHLGFLGNAQFTGRVENAGVYAVATLDVTLDDVVKQIVLDAIEIIFGRAGGWFAEFISNWIAYQAASFLPIDTLHFELDTRGDVSYMTLSISLAVPPLGIPVTLPNIHIQWGGGSDRRRRQLSGRKYPRVEAYRTKHGLGAGEHDIPKRFLTDEHMIDCLDGDTGPTFEDMVDWIADAFNWTQIAEFLRICVPEETQNHGPGEPCAKDNQCANHTLFPDGQWCDRDGKISMGLLCVGACSPRYDPGEQVPLLKKAACKSNKEICGMCTEIGEEVVPMNSSCAAMGSAAATGTLR